MLFLLHSASSLAQTLLYFWLPIFLNKEHYQIQKYQNKYNLLFYKLLDTEEKYVCLFFYIGRYSTNPVSVQNVLWNFFFLLQAMVMDMHNLFHWLSDEWLIYRSHLQGPRGKGYILFLFVTPRPGTVSDMCVDTFF